MKNYKFNYEFNGTISNSVINDNKIILSLDEMPNQWSKLEINWNVNFKTWKDHKFSGNETLDKDNVSKRIISEKTIIDTNGLAQQKFLINHVDIMVKSFFAIELYFSQASHLSSNSEFVEIDIKYKFS
ncbi:MAG: hypothetical protein HRT99_03140 [Mycoplasmatales bacterium]|nr:hypothetical protein [Mycoplasmatales bacterium]